MTIQRMEHVVIVVDDLAAATAFFVELGLKLQGEGPVEGGWVDRVVGLEGVRAEIAMVETPDGHGRLELTKFHTPSGRGGDRVQPRRGPGRSLLWRWLGRGQRLTHRTPVHTMPARQPPDRQLLDPSAPTNRSEQLHT